MNNVNHEQTSLYCFCWTCLYLEHSDRVALFDSKKIKMADEGALLLNDRVRRVYLITYSQVNADKFPTRESFVLAVLDAFAACDIQIINWVCAREDHRVTQGFHYHMTV